ncbi:M24 family metallopeptidase [Jongsikchunia kroppenstedtii]|uniref:M24 family metallopeptidase n=1 Tax=Jongsikchunia kroppenstedtii TaxID=1121721 RepID=UPI00037285E0|nr:Xaa-Pro peptidase family protein [Jongsikchunia kroppenstedtii]
MTAPDDRPSPSSPQRFPASVYADRVARAAALAAAAGLSGIVVTPGPDLRYLVGAHIDTFERISALVIPAEGDPAVVAPRMELAALRDSALTEIGVPIRDWVDGDDTYGMIVEALGDGAARVGVSDAMPALHSVPLGDRLGIRLELATGVLRELRMIKDASEIEALRRAGAAIDAVHRQVPGWLKAGRTEGEIAADIESAMLAAGHTRAEFIIVGSGPNGADPHHEVSDRVIEDGDIVVVDIGGPVAPGYNSDCTRTYVVGDVDGQAAHKIEVLRQAQQAAVDAVRPGATAESIDAAARDVLAAAGLADAFVHRTGHGIGLSVHEEPYIVAGNDLVLREGMAFSIEPGIYFPGGWGARIEDIVIVTADGCESVNNTQHGLTQAG